MVDLRSLLAVVDYFLPRELLGVVIIGFSIENVLFAVFSATVPPRYSPLGWVAVIVFATLIFGYWGWTDEEDNDELDDLLDEVVEDD